MPTKKRTFTTQKQFDAFVKKNHVFLVQPTLTQRVFLQLISCLNLFGHHIDKDRGTMQSTTMDTIEAGADDYATFIKTQRECVADAAHGTLLNDFFNINHGMGAAKPTKKRKKSQEVSDEATNGGDGGGWHRDNPSQGPTGSPNTGRVLSYYMQPGKHGSLRVRADGFEYEINVPSGCSVYCTNALLEEEHSHGINGICISIVSEVSATRMPTPATQEEIAKAAAAQAAEPLPFLQHFGKWKPEDWFLGPKRKWGQLGVGSVWRLAMAWLRGPRLGRGNTRAMSKDKARETLRAMSKEELLLTAAKQGSKIGKLSSFDSRRKAGVSEEAIEATRLLLIEAGKKSSFASRRERMAEDKKTQEEIDAAIEATRTRQSEAKQGENNSAYVRYGSKAEFDAKDLEELAKVKREDGTHDYDNTGIMKPTITRRLYVNVKKAYPLDALPTIKRAPGENLALRRALTMHEQGETPEKITSEVKKIMAEALASRPPPTAGKHAGKRKRDH